MNFWFCTMHSIFARRRCMVLYFFLFFHNFCSWDIVFIVCLVGNHGIIPSMHALFPDHLRVVVEAGLLCCSYVNFCFSFFASNKASPLYFLLFYVTFHSLHWFGFFDLVPWTTIELGDGYAYHFLFFLVCFCTYNSCWSSLNNYPKLLYDNRF